MKLPVHLLIIPLLCILGILRDIEWRMIMGMPLPPNETEVIDYINYCVDIFLKGHHKV